MCSIRLKFLNCAAIFPLNVNVQYTNFSLAEFRGMIEIGGRAGMQNIWRVIARPASRARYYWMTGVQVNRVYKSLHHIWISSGMNDLYSASEGRESSHFTVNVSSKMVLGGRSGVVVPWPGVCRGTSQCCSESEHWRGCSTDSWASDGRQQPSCSLSPSGDLSLSSANLLTDTKMIREPIKKNVENSTVGSEWLKMS